MPAVCSWRENSRGPPEQNYAPATRNCKPRAMQKGPGRLSGNPFHKADMSSAAHFVTFVLFVVKFQGSGSGFTFFSTRQSIT